MGELVGDEPSGDGGRGPGPAHHLPYEEGLLAQHGAVAVKVATGSPGQVEVLAGHVADQHCRHGLHPEIFVRLQEAPETFHERLVHHVGRRLEVRPQEERPGKEDLVLGQSGELGPDDSVIVGPPHQRTTRPRPEVHP